MFWRVASSVRKVKDQMDMGIKNVGGNILTKESDFKAR